MKARHYESDTSAPDWRYGDTSYKISRYIRLRHDLLAAQNKLAEIAAACPGIESIASAHIAAEMEKHERKASEFRAMLNTL